LLGFLLKFCSDFARILLGFCLNFVQILLEFRSKFARIFRAFWHGGSDVKNSLFRFFRKHYTFNSFCDKIEVSKLILSFMVDWRRICLRNMFQTLLLRLARVIL
jgi:hypothetical protein